jgi:hypothetical protein
LGTLGFKAGREGKIARSWRYIEYGVFGRERTSAFQACDAGSTVVFAPKIKNMRKLSI